MADDVTVTFGAKIDELIKGVDQVNKSLGGVQKAAEATNEKFGDLGKRIAEFFAIDKAIEFVNSIAELGTRIEDMTQSLGGSVQQVVSLTGVAQLSGISMEGLGVAIERMSLNMQRATRDAFSPQAQAMKVLGLSAKEMIGIPADQWVLKLSDAVAKFNPSLERTAAVTALGGRGIAQMIPLLSMGSERFKELQKQVDAAREGLANAVPGMADTNTKIGLLSMSMVSLAARIFSVLKPAIDKIIETMTNWAQSIDSGTIIRGVQTVANAVATIMSAVGSFAITVMGVLDQLGTKMGDIGQKASMTSFGAAVGAGVGVFAGGVGAVPGALVGGGIGLMVSQIKAWWEGGSKATEDGQKLMEDRRKALEEFIAKFKETMASLTAAMTGDTGHGTPGGPKLDAAAINMMARQQIESQVQVIQTQIALLREGLNQKKIIYETDAALWRTTDDQKFASSMQAAQQEYGLELAKLQQIRDLWPAHSREWEAANRQMVAATAQFNTQIVQMNAQSVLSMKSKWDEVFGAIQSSFNSSLRGLLAGTMTWGQAFRTLLGDMIIFFIQLVERMVFNWIAGQIAMRTASQTTAAATAAAQTAGMEATLPVRIAKFTSDLTADAALVFAGVFANLAPLLGPAAAGPAAASQATVLAQLANVPKFETGTDYVPNTGLAVVHQGERIIPANQNKPGLGTSVVFQISALDGADVMRVLKTRGRDIAKMLQGVMHDNPSVRPAT